MFACFYICLNGPIQQSPAIGLTARTMYCTSLSCICLAEASLADSMRYQSFLQYRILPRFTVPALRPSRSLLLWVCFRRGGHSPHVGVFTHGVPAHVEHSGDLRPRAPGGIHRPYIIHCVQGHGHLLRPSRAGSPKEPPGKTIRRGPRPRSPGRGPLASRL